MIYLRLILIFLCLSLVACEKEAISPGGGGGHDHFLVDESLYPLLFDKGSYWIYENKENNVVDTVEIGRIEMDTIGPFNTGHGYSNSYQSFDLVCYSKLMGVFFITYFWDVISISSHEGPYLYLSGDEIGRSWRNARIAAIHDSLIINGLVYNKVVEMDIMRDYQIENDMNLYYVDSIGLIKKEIKEDSTIIETWELIEHSVKYFDVP